MPSQEIFILEVSGDFACFTRPEMKVERVSYDLITPSAASAIFEAILWKPALSWHVHKIELLKPIRFLNLRRNEVASVASPKKSHILIEDDRQQRASLLLRDVAYRLHARFTLKDDSHHQHRYPSCKSPDEGSNSYPKFAEMFKRRAQKGQCFHQPYLGTREFPARFRLIETGKLAAEAPPLDHSQNLGWMLWGMDYKNPADPTALFFNAELKQGVLDVPASIKELRQ